MDPEKLAGDRTWLCTVLFMDIVGYSTKSVQLQARLKGRFNGYLSHAIGDVAAAERVMLDTGDGAAICFLGAPEEAMFIGLKLRSSFLRDVVEHDTDLHDAGLRVRMGINLGPVKLVRDINDSLNAIGDGINTGQRVMSFAGENDVLVSRSFFEVVSCLSEDYKRLFKYVGARKDKHVREHLVYRLLPSDEQGGAQATPASEHTPRLDVAREFAAPVTFGPETMAALAALLGSAIGPIAGHLVKQAAEQVFDAAGLIRELASHISDPAAREEFLAQASRLATGSAEPAQVLPAAGVEASPAWDADWLEKVRKELTNHIGPMARVLVDRTTKRVRSRKELCEVLSAEVPAAQRKRFLTALGAE